MKTKLACLMLGLVGAAVLMCVGLTNLSPGAGAVQADETKTAAPQVVLAETYNAVTRIYFTNIAVHKARTNPVSSNGDFGPMSGIGSWTPSITTVVS